MLLMSKIPLNDFDAAVIPCYVSLFAYPNIIMAKATKSCSGDCTDLILNMT